MPGISRVTNQRKLLEIQRKCQDMCERKRDSGFPGLQSVWMNFENLVLLKQTPHKVSWKADGTRYMMLIDGVNQVYFLDCDNCVFRVSNLRFPRRKFPEEHVFGTLVDGEMVIDRVDGKEILNYLIFDVVTFENQEIGKMSFDFRMVCIRKELVEPRRNNLVEKNSEPFGVKNKDFWDLSMSEKLLSDKFKKHVCDGLIYQPIQMPYSGGPNTNSVLKWNSIRTPITQKRLLDFIKNQPSKRLCSEDIIPLDSKRSVDVVSGEIALKQLTNNIKNSKVVKKKPNGTAFYRTYLEKCNLNLVVRPKIIRDKVRALKSKYAAAVAWKNRTGQGLKDAENIDEKGIKDHILKLCPHYDVLAEIYHKKANVHLPQGILDSGQEVIQVQLAEPSTSTNTIEVVETDSDEEDDNQQQHTHDEEEYENIPEKRKSDISFFADGNLKKKAAITGKNRNPIKELQEVIINAADRFSPSTNPCDTKRLDFEEKRLEWEIEKEKREFQLQQEKLNLEVKKLEFEREKLKHELDMQKIKQEHELELAKIKLATSN
uniref:mRNA capping enzyme adenylation domain-containing protein n=1 Tax=Strigamia maritima TaxID=126957 RepID=T1IMX0_STRMM